MEQENSYDKYFQDQTAKSVKSAMQTASDKDPDLEAKIIKLAKMANVPLEAARLDTPTVERRVALESIDYDTLVKKYPSTAQLLSDPTTAALAKDDVSNVSALEDTLNFGANFGRSLAASIPSASAGIYGALQAPAEMAAAFAEPFAGRVLPFNPLSVVADKLIDWRKMATATSKAIEGEQEGMGFTQKSALSGAKSLGQNSLLLVASVLSRSPAPLLYAMSTITGGEAYGKARDKGTPIGGSLTFATSQALIEYATEKLPAIYLLRDIGLKSSFRKMLTNQLITEVPGEQVATVFQDLNEWAVLNPEKPFSDYLAERPSAAAQTLIATMVATGGQVTIMKAADRLANGSREKQAVDILTALKDGVANSKTFERAPERIKDFIAKHTANGPMENIFIPAEQMQRYFQTAQIDPAAAASEMGAKNFAEALATGGDVVIPLSDFISSTVKTQHYDGLINDIRFNQGEMTAREADLYDKNHPDEIRRIIEEAQKQPLPDLAAQPEVVQMTDDITGQLVAGGMEQSTAASYAQTYANVMKNLAERSGMNPMALHQQYGLQVVTPIADILSKIGTSDIHIDPLLDMLRSASIPSGMQINGPSLIEFIRDIGGINDTGGELRQMEVDQDKAPFVKNLAQLTGRGIDEVTALANEAGYQVDDLLGGIEQEIAGKPVYSAKNTNEQLQKRAQELNELAEYLQQLGIDLNTASNDDVRKAMAAAVGNVYDQSNKQTEDGDERDLIITHNLSAENLLHAVKMGGLAVPSLAITKKDTPLSGFGEITLISSKEMADPKGYAGTKVFGADVYSPRYPKTTLTFDKYSNKRLNKILSEALSAVGKDELYLNEADSEDLAKHPAIRWMVLQDMGIPFEPIMKDGKVDSYKTEWAINDAIRNANALDATKAKADDVLAMSGAKEQVFQGHTPSGRRKYVDHTIENVVKILKKELRAGEDFNYGAGTLRAKVTPQFKSIAQIKKEKGRLTSSEQFEKIKTEIDQELQSLTEPLAQYHESGDSFEFPNIVLTTLMEAAAMGLPRAVKDNGFSEVPEGMLMDMAEFMAKLRELPTAYFEAKILRDVSLSEFSGAVVPEGVDEKVIAALKASGITDVKTYATSNEADRAAKIAEFETLFFQADKTFHKAKRGYIQFGADRKFKIALLENADLSTFLHETGHFWLEVMGDLANSANGSEQIKADYAEILKFLHVEGREQIGVEQHELFARANEAYLREGKAPSPALRAVFQKFKAWLTMIYKSMDLLDVKLTDEVRGVFNRIYAADAEIEAANDEVMFPELFATAKDAGMSEEEFSAYKGSVAAATERGKDELRAKLMRQYAREKLVWWNTELDKTRAEVGEELDAQPVYQAFDVLSKGELPDGTPFKLNKAALIDQFGKDYIKKLPRGYGEGRGSVFATDGTGMQHDAAAELLGYGSGAEMVQALINMRPRKELIEAEAKKRMIEEHGDILTDGTIADEATAALHNEERAHILRTELMALHKKQHDVAPFVKIEKQTAAKVSEFAAREREYERRWLEAEKNLALEMERGIADERVREVKTEIANLKEEAARLKREREYEQRWIEAERNTEKMKARQATEVPPASAFKEAARSMIGQAQVRDIRPYPYLLAERKASKAAFSALAKGEYIEAATQKQRELLNHYLYLEATDALETVDDIYAYARKFASPNRRAKFGKAGATYLEQIDDLLDQYEFSSIPKSDIVRREKLLQFIQDRIADDEPVMIPPAVLLDAQQRNYKTLSFDELQAVRDAIKNIEHMVNLKTKLLKIQSKRALAEVVDEGAASIAEYGSLKQAPIGTRTWLDSAKEIRDGYLAAHRKLASLLREMDGWKDDGFMWNTIMQPINEAATEKAVRTEDATKKLSALYAKLQKPGLGNKLKGLGLLAKEYYPTLGRSMSKSDILSLALNYGNEGNRQRIRDGYNWTDEQVLGALDRLQPNEWEFVEGTWALIDSYWTEISAQDQRVNGIAPEKVERSGFVLPNGRMVEGGYYPIKYDERHSVRSYNDRAKEEADRILRGAVARPGVDTGFTEARAGKIVNRKIKLDLGVGNAHLDTVIQTLTHREMLIDLNKILGAPKMNGAILDYYGIETYKTIQQAIVDIAAGEIGAENAFGKSMAWARSGVAVAGMGLNFMTAAMQGIGFTQSIVRIGPKWVGRGITRFIGDAMHMESATKFVYDRSSMMRLRSVTQNREIADIRNQIHSGGVMPKVEETYFYMIVKMQAVVDVPTWLGAYEKYMEQTGSNEPKAIALADQAVIDAQGGGQMKDLASIQRGGPLQKLFTTFYSYFSATWNQTVESVGRTDFKKINDIGKFAVDMMLLYTLPVVLTAALKGALRGGEGPDDDEEWYAWLIKEQLSYMTGTLVGLREISSSIQGMYGYSGPAGTRLFSESGKLIKQAEQGEPDAALAKAANNTAGILFHYPAGQVQRTSEGFIALKDGETSNPAALLFGKPKEK